ncbi:NAD(P)-binding protein [Hortaea werneckii]|nr:NAD(P)-binding protein [Hortaea werneckii]
MAQLRNLVVTGATGKQGGALISALLAQPSTPFTIYAVTRNTTSASAQRLKMYPQVKLIRGDFDSAQSIFRQIEQPWGVFAMTDQMAGEKLEEKQGKALVKAAIDAGVQHVVFSATDRGGQRKSDNNPTYVPHFRSKYNVERDIIAKANASKGKLTWTFLRPVAFFENLAPGFFGKGYLAMWRGNGYDRRLQHITSEDIGKVAADVFLNADSDEYHNKAISIAGDELSPNEAAKIFQEVTGQDIPATFDFVGRLLKMGVKDLRLMFRWFLEEDFGVDVKAVKKRYPFVRDYRGWLKEESAWRGREMH